MKSLMLKLTGQVVGGKNNVIVTRSGLRIPPKRFVAWKKAMLKQLAAQVQGLEGELPIAQSVNAEIQYWAGDARRRDAPAVIDSIWHVLEKAGIVKDDKHIGDFGSFIEFVNNGIDRKNPRVELRLWV